jgi:16S rRNA (guanine966-N2)-methyltransferase
VRVIAGSARGRPLVGPTWGSTRPTSDRVKEALFGILDSLLGVATEGIANPWEGLRVLDLYAGSGALGIEALSRGAAFVDFVDSDRRCERLIQENLRRTDLSSRGKAHAIAAASYVSTLSTGETWQGFGLVLLDPPYGEDQQESLLAAIGRSGCLADGCLVGLERSSRARPVDWEQLSRTADLRLIRERRHGDTTLVIMQH